MGKFKKLIKSEEITSLLDLLEGKSGKGMPRESQPKPPLPLLKPPPAQTRSSSIPPISDSWPESSDPKRKRPSKGKDPVDGGQSHSSPEEGEARRPSKQLRLDDLKKVIESLEEMTRAKDSAASDLATAMKQAEDQTKRLQDIEGQLQAAQEDITDLKQKLAEAVGVKGIAEYAKEEAGRAKDEAVFARIDAERSVEQAEEEAFAEGVAKTEATLKAQIPKVCRRFCSQTWNEAFNQAGVDASSDLKRVEKVYYPPAIREVTLVTSEAESALPVVGESQTKTAEGTPSVDKPVEGVELHRALDGAGIDGKEVPQVVVKPPVDPQATLVAPQIPLAGEGSSEVAP
ncbi:uncharacterized protein LOC112028956 [Quercus suber]|uniref:uncharacterized protein LOC112028956 n=1 Tax=Quercus suber TaxID=58331 RepID=UPI000CE2187F|nr:uncharacterized protein LOC112028956 [Quercus suber]